jgi:ferritin-like metal-binding protein YciE
MLLGTLSDVFERGLEFAYDCEQQLLQELPKMEQAAESAELKGAFAQQLDAARQHLERLEQIFAKLERVATAEHKDPIRAITSETETMISHIDQSALLDAALIVLGKQLAHYKIALYESLGSFARVLNLPDPAALLEQTLTEETAAEQRLVQIAETSVNRDAVAVRNRPHMLTLL